MDSYKLKFQNGRCCTIECDNKKSFQDKINEAENRFGSEVVEINGKAIKKHSLGGFLVGATIGAILGNSVPARTISKTVSGVKRTTKQVTKNVKKQVRKFDNGGGTSDLPHYKVKDEIFVEYDDAMNYCDENNLSYDEIIKTKQYAKGGGVPRWWNKQVRDYQFFVFNTNTNKVWAGNEYESDAKDELKEFKLDNPDLPLKVLTKRAITNKKINPLAYENWVRSTEQFAEIRGEKFADGGMSSMALAGASPQLAIADQISQRLPETTKAVDRKFAERVYSDKPKWYEDRGMQEYGNGGSTINQTYQIQNSQGQFYSRNMKGQTVWNDSSDMGYIFDEHEMKDTLLFLKRSGFQDVKEVPYKKQYATGGTIGQAITFKHWAGDIKSGTITEELENGNYQVSSGFGNVLVNKDDIISYDKASQPKKKFLGLFAEGGAIKNQYESRTPDDIWDNLTKKQKEHFLIDHFIAEEDAPQVEYKNLNDDDKEFVDSYSNNEWKKLDGFIKTVFKKHVKIGQYAKGGGVSENEKGFYVFSNKRNEIIADGFKTEAEAKEFMYNYFQSNNDFSLSVKAFAKGGGVRKINGREYSYGRNWTNDHRHHNKSEDYEIPLNARKRKFEDGGLLTDSGYLKGDNANPEDYVLIVSNSNNNNTVTFVISKKELNKVPASSLKEKAKVFLMEMSENNDYGFYYSFEELITDKNEVSDYLKGYNHSNYLIVIDKENPSDFRIKTTNK
jgi:hypothetical protein